MKLSRCLPKVLAALALGSLAVAAPQLTGSAVGAWQEISARSTLVEGQMTESEGPSIYRLQALLIGYERGVVYGEMEQLPQGKDGEAGGGLVHLVYQLEGTYHHLVDGRVHVRARILFDLNQFGIPSVVTVGELDGLLLPPDSIGYCPPPLSPAPPATDPSIEPIGNIGQPDANVDGDLASIPAPIGKPPHGEFIARWLLH